MNDKEIDALEEEYYSGKEWNWNRVRYFLERMAGLFREIKRLRARNDTLMETVKSLIQIEFVDYELECYCPWCKRFSGHYDDCPRLNAENLIRIFKHQE